MAVFEGAYGIFKWRELASNICLEELKTFIICRAPLWSWRLSVFFLCRPFRHQTIETHSYGALADDILSEWMSLNSSLAKVKSDLFNSHTLIEN